MSCNGPSAASGAIIWIQAIFSPQVSDCGIAPSADRRYRWGWSLLAAFRGFESSFEFAEDTCGSFCTLRRESGNGRAAETTAAPPGNRSLILSALDNSTWPALLVQGNPPARADLRSALTTARVGLSRIRSKRYTARWT